MSTKKPGHWDLARLELFVRAAREGNLTRAAASVAMPQPAISRQISKLEEECGGRLFLRTGRGVTLSPLGERVLPQVQEMLEQAQLLSRLVEDGVAAPSGNVRIAALPSLSATLIVPLFALLRRRFPGIRLHVFEGSGGQIDKWLATGFVDIALPYRYGRRVTPDVEKLVSVSSYLLGPAGDTLTRMPTVKFAQLDGLPLVLPSAPSAVRRLLDQLAKKAGITLNVVIEADSTTIHKAIAAGAGAYAVLPLNVINSQDTLQAARIVEPTIDRIIAMGIASSHPATQATREVARCIRQLAHGLSDAMPDSA